MTHPALSDTLADLAKRFAPARQPNLPPIIHPEHVYIYSTIEGLQFKAPFTAPVRAALYGVNGYAATYGNRPRDGFRVVELTEAQTLAYMAERKAIASGTDEQAGAA